MRVKAEMDGSYVTAIFRGGFEDSTERNILPLGRAMSVHSTLHVYLGAG